MSNKIYTAWADSATLVTSLVKLAKDLRGGGQIYFNVTSSVPKLSVVKQVASCSTLETDPEIVQLISTLAAVPAIGLVSMQIHYLPHPRDGQNFNLEYRDDNEGTYFILPDADSPQVAQNVIDKLAKNFSLIKKDEAFAAAMPSAAKAAIEFQLNSVGQMQAVVGRLAEVAESIVQKNTESLRRQSEEMERHFRDRQAAEDRKHDEKQKSEDHRHHLKEAEANQKIAIRQSELDAKETAFRAEKQALDDRNPTVKRRENEGKILGILKDKQSGLSWKFRGSTIWLHLICLSSLVASGIFFSFAAGHLYAALGSVQSPTPTTAPTVPANEIWTLIPPISLSGLFFVGTMVFYLRWWAKQIDDQARYERSRSQFELDISRAYWIAELVSEFKDNNKPLPKVVLASLTAGLFERAIGQNGKYHPVDQVTGLLENLGSMKVGPGSFELTAREGKKRS